MILYVQHLGFMLPALILDLRGSDSEIRLVCELVYELALR